MKILFDTDVVLDLLLDRTPHSFPAASLLSMAERGSLEGYLCATAVTTVHYLAARTVGPARARQQIRTLLSFLEIAPVQREVLIGALDASFRDFEDAVAHGAARLVQADAIVTRNLRHFRPSTIPVYSASDMLALIQASGKQRGH